MAGAWGQLGIWNYTYGAGNERVEALGPADGSRRVYFYDVTGEWLGEYSVLVNGPGKLYPKQERMRVSFAGRPLEWEDRLGSKVVGPIDQQTGQATRYRYYPYGRNIGTNVGWDDVQFATYTRDGATGLDYARNRYYTRTWGRFLSPDPYVASSGPADPGSWNRYAYVQGDPVNYHDPGGLQRLKPVTFLGMVPCYFEGALANCPGWVTSYVVESSEELTIGGGASFDRDGFRPVGYNGALQALEREDCWKGLLGFKNAVTAKRAFESVKFEKGYLGNLQVTPDSIGNLLVFEGTPPPAQTIGNNVIVNYNYNWFDFSSVTAYNVKTKKDVSVNYLAGIQSELGEALATAQLAVLIVLHEFRHTMAGGNAPQERTFQEMNLPIYEKCIR